MPRIVDRIISEEVNVCEDSSASTDDLSRLGEAIVTPPASLDTASPGDEAGITTAVRFGRVAKSIESGLYDENITPPKLRGFVTSSNVTDTIRAGSGKFYTSDTTTGEMILFNKKHSPTDLPFTEQSVLGA